jgi:lipopolysaccharide export LptBFGC system permease protein LptF
VTASAAPAATAPRRRLFARLGPPGIIARQDFLGEILFVVTVQTILLLVAVSIDLAKYLDQVLESAAGLAPLDRILLVAHYLGLRVVDMVTRLLPIAVFVGVLAFEVWSILTRRRAIHWISGRNPLRVLLPAAAVGLLFGALQYRLDTVWRPAAVLAQAAERLGAYGERYDRERIRRDVWFIAGDRIVHGDVRYGPPPEFLDVDLFRLDKAGRIREVVRAARAEPTPLAAVWRFDLARRWLGDPERPGALRLAPAPVQDLVPIPLHPLAVTYLGLPAKYVPQDDLAAIVASGGAGAGAGMLVSPDHRVWLEVRRADALLPLAMALLATTVSFFAGATRPGLGVLIGAGLAGYAVHVGSRVFVTAGELGDLDPRIAAWTPVLATFVAVAGLLAIVAARRWRA